MALPLLHSQVTHVRQLTHDVREVTFALREPATVSFKAGQYLYLVVPPSGDHLQTKRAYSLCSSPGGQQSITLLANLVRGGAGSTYFFALAEGDHVQMHGPSGHFTVDETTPRDYLFVATGTGIAPIRSMILATSERAPTKPMLLIWGLRSDRDLYYQDEFAELTRQQPHFRCVTTLSQPTDRWTGAIGRVTAVLPRLVTTARNLDVYLCGSQAMINEVKTAFRTIGLCPIHIEKFY